MGLHRTQAGFGALEFAIVVGITALFLATFSDVFSTSDELAHLSRVNHRAQEELRRNLEAVANVLRGAELDSIEGFDEDGTATNPTFGRVVGVDAVGRIYDGAEELRWVATSEKVNGVTSPGEILHIRDGVKTVVARKVPKDGFRLSVEAGTLAVWLQTYYTAEHETQVVAGETAVSLRN